MFQLKLKTEYSFGKTFAPIKRVIKRLKGIDCKAAGIVDESTWGHVDWHQSCRKEGIKPLLGVEVCVSDDDTNPRMWFIAKNLAGLKELYGYTSKSYYQKAILKFGAIPRLYRNDIINMSDNIIKFAGEITDGEFLKEVGAYIDISPASRILNSKKLKTAGNFNLNVVGISDNSFSSIDDKEIFELISKAGLKQTPQYILETLQYQDIAEKIADMCEDFDLPKAPMIHMEGNLEEYAEQELSIEIWNGMMFMKKG